MKMKFIWSWIVLCSIAACNGNKKGSDSQPSNLQQQDTSTLGKDFIHHFQILDSIAHTNSDDTLYVAGTPSIAFMEVNTGIDAHSDGTTLGKIKFSKQDLRKWHQWFDKYYKTNK